MSSEHRDRDPDLEWVEKRWARQQQDLATDAPPDLVDQAVLNAARRALPAADAAGASGSRAGRGIRWIGGFATAAVMILAVGLVLRQDDAELSRRDQPERDGIRTEAAAEAAPPAAAPGQALRQAAKREAYSRDEPAERHRAADMAIVMDPDLAEETPAAEAWLEELRRLYEAGATEDFIRERDAFLRAYPDYVLPQDLARE